jgi:hypothetical protein
MPLWTDVIDPATLTGYARASLADYEARKGTLARWLPNREVSDIVARFVAGQTGLVPVAKFRAYDAPPEITKRPSGKRVTLELPALGTDIPVSEYEQLRLLGASVEDARVLVAIQNATRQVVAAVSDAAERLRGIVLSTGKATIDQDNYQSDDNFGRPASNQLVADNLWSSGSVSRLEYLQTISDVYLDVTGEQAGCMVMGNRVFRAMATGDEFQTQLLNGGARPATEQQVQDTVSGAGLPPIIKFDRRVRVGDTTTRVIPDDTILLLPAPVDPDAWEDTELGATFWGRTLTSTDPAWGIEDAEQPGIVAGVYRNEKPPMIAEVISDAIALPVLANAELSLAAKVL